MNLQGNFSYRYCVSLNKPYFGRYLQAFQGAHARHGLMSLLIDNECKDRVLEEYKILEIGSWAGGSAITWANALKKNKIKNGTILCIDPWKVYFDTAEVTDAKSNNSSLYNEMTEALKTGKILTMFKHNIKSSDNESMVIPIQEYSDRILPLIRSDTFDIVYVDGAHSYTNVVKDLENSIRLVKDGGILCGDDLELQAGSADADMMHEYREKDYIQDPRTGVHYHPGVAMAVSEILGEVSEREGFWAMRKRGTSWVKVPLADFELNEDSIPNHIRTSNATMAQSDYKHYNILSYMHLFYGIAQSVGPIDITMTDDDRLKRLQQSGHCIIGESLEETKRLIDSMIG